ncbi:hypothetical protein M0805_001848 [Coniferiporia weirii]|nr:hypothetical protein M0805_001848 [Coniferiporia weirii]
MASIAKPMLARSKYLSLTFLGTSGIGGPSSSRAGAAISINIGDKSNKNMQHWLVNCGEGTRRQLARASHPTIGVRNVRKVFLSQVSMRQCMGIIPLMANIMNPHFNGRQNELLLEFYGLAGLRKFIRDNLEANNLRLRGKYVVHELHPATELEYNQKLLETDEATQAFRDKIKKRSKNPSEILGKDLACKFEDGRLWLDIVPDSPNLRVDACLAGMEKEGLAFVFTERQGDNDPSSYATRKIAILGSTAYPPAIKHVAMDASVLVHGMQHALIPPNVLDSAKESHASLEDPVEHQSGDAPISTEASASETHFQDVANAKPVAAVLDGSFDTQTAKPPTKITGPLDSSTFSKSSPKNPGSLSATSDPFHSGYVTPDMVGEFARSVRARRLYINQFSPNFQSPEPISTTNGLENSQILRRSLVMAEIERQATETFGRCPAIAAHDLLVVPMLPEEQVAPAGSPGDTKAPA